jgi:hypothetical protein
MAMVNDDTEKVLLPNGTGFPFWDDLTVYRRIYHVARLDPAASDDNPGTRERPFATIGRAAEVLEPGEKVVVHEGIYRECVVPRRGGTGQDGMIAYEAGDGEYVTISGTREWKPVCRPSKGWKTGVPESNIMMADIPPEFFVGYNPFLARNMYEEFLSYRNLDDAPKYLLRRGAVFVNGKPLSQVIRYSHLSERDGAFWVEEPGLRIHFRLSGDEDPAQANFEVTVREQLFAPIEFGLGYIRVSGFHFERAADGVPVPQRAMVSASRGHHWIIENNFIRWANACGLDVGAQDWKAFPRDGQGGHIIRRNLIADCGVCGIAGCSNVDNVLVEDNTIERVGSLGIEQMWEVAGLKFHVARNTLIRRNVFRDMDRACGVWLDSRNVNCRVTGNLFHRIVSCHGAAFMEHTDGPNLIDQNVFWDVRISEAFGNNPRNGTAVNSDNSNGTVTAHNFIARSEGFGVMMNALQEETRKGECHRNRVLNNVFFDCPLRVFLGNSETNRSDGNLFDAGNTNATFDIQLPAPDPKPDFTAWQERFGQDRHSLETPMDAVLDLEAGVLHFTCPNLTPDCLPVPELGDLAPSGTGPFDAAAVELLRTGKTAVVDIPTGAAIALAKIDEQGIVSSGEELRCEVRR